MIRLNCLIVVLLFALSIVWSHAETQSQPGQLLVRSAPAFKKPTGSTAPVVRVKPLKKSLPAAPHQRTVALPPLPPELIEELKRQDAAEIKRRLRIGLGRLLDGPVVVSSTNTAISTWNVLPNGWHVWSLELTSQDALGLRLGLQSVNLPAGARLLVYDPANQSPEATPLTQQSVAGQSQVWTETVLAQTVVLECQAAPEVDLSAISFSVTTAVHYYRSILPPEPKSTGCEKNVACFPAWADQAAGVARIEFVDGSSAYLCTGCLLNDSVPGTTIDYFLTANHCIGNQAVASSLEIWWFYQANSCGGTAPDVNSVPHTGGGASFLAGSDQSDFTLLRLHNAPPDGVTYLGWSTALPAGGETLSCIQHPEGSEKKISFGHKVPPDPSFPDFTAVRWSDGVTEEGSSGSPLLNAAHQVIGQLYGGTSACDNLSGIDIFGRFDISYWSMQQWIDPNALAVDLYPRAKGTYTGLFSTDAPAVESAGFCTLTLTSKGTFTGSLQVAGKHQSFAGTFNLTDSDIALPRSGSTALSLHFNLDPSPGSDLLTGTISDGNWSASLSARRSTFNSRTNPAPYAGSYTVIIPGISGSQSPPEGYGYGTLKVDSNGKAKFAGSLADGTPITQSTQISEEGDWPLFGSLYGGKGVLWASMVIASRASDDLHGDLSWIKKPQNAKFFPGGFTNEITAIGSFYQNPNGGQIINMSDGTAAFAGGNLSSSFANSITLTPDNKVVNHSDNKLIMSFALPSGLLHGSVTPPDGSHSLSLRGVALQKSNKAYGYFLGTDQSGSVIVTP